MTPARRQKLTEAVALIRAASNADSFERDGVTEALVAMGAIFGETPVPTDDDEDLAFCLILEGVSALCAWDNGEQLITRWAANARAALEEDDPEPSSDDLFPDAGKKVNHHSVDQSGYAEMIDWAGEDGE